MAQNHLIDTSKKIELSKYLTIPFKHNGRSWDGVDCYGLVKLFFDEEFGVKLYDYKYDPNWSDKGLNLINKEYSKVFRKIDIGKKFCGIGFKKLGFDIMSHMGIVLDGNKFLHIPRNQKVCIERIDNRVWQKLFFGFFEIL